MEAFMVISLPPEVEQLVSCRARAEGLALSKYVERLLLDDESCRRLLERLSAEECSGLRFRY